jgi:hypothetical protein
VPDSGPFALSIFLCWNYVIEVLIFEYALVKYVARFFMPEMQLSAIKEHNNAYSTRSWPCSSFARFSNLIYSFRKR